MLINNGEDDMSSLLPLFLCLGGVVIVAAPFFACWWTKRRAREGRGWNEGQRNVITFPVERAEKEASGEGGVFVRYIHTLQTQRTSSGSAAFDFAQLDRSSPLRNFENIEKSIERTSSLELERSNNESPSPSFQRRSTGDQEEALEEGGKEEEVNLEVEKKEEEKGGYLSRVLGSRFSTIRIFGLSLGGSAKGEVKRGEKGEQGGEIPKEKNTSGSIEVERRVSGEEEEKEKAGGDQFPVLGYSSEIQDALFLARHQKTKISEPQKDLPKFRPMKEPREVEGETVRKHFPDYDAVYSESEGHKQGTEERFPEFYGGLGPRLAVSSSHLGEEKKMTLTSSSLVSPPPGEERMPPNLGRASSLPCRFDKGRLEEEEGGGRKSLKGEWGGGGLVRCTSCHERNVPPEVQRFWAKGGVKKEVR